jgi:hypothetical protein
MMLAPYLLGVFVGAALVCWVLDAARRDCPDWPPMPEDDHA